MVARKGGWLHKRWMNDGWMVGCMYEQRCNKCVRRVNERAGKELLQFQMKCAVGQHRKMAHTRTGSAPSPACLHCPSFRGAPLELLHPLSPPQRQQRPQASSRQQSQRVTHQQAVTGPAKQVQRPQVARAGTAHLRTCSTPWREVASRPANADARMMDPVARLCR
jgi:hypothetical protein